MNEIQILFFWFYRSCYQQVFYKISFSLMHFSKFCKIFKTLLKDWYYCIFDCWLLTRFWLLTHYRPSFKSTVNWFAEQFNSLVSTRGKHWLLSIELALWFSKSVRTALRDALPYIPIITINFVISVVTNNFLSNSLSFNRHFRFRNWDLATDSK